MEIQRLSPLPQVSCTPYRARSGASRRRSLVSFLGVFCQLRWCDASYPTFSVSASSRSAGVRLGSPPRPRELTQLTRADLDQPHASHSPLDESSSSEGSSPRTNPARPLRPKPNARDQPFEWLPRMRRNPSSVARQPQRRKELPVSAAGPPQIRSRRYARLSISILNGWSSRMIA